MYPRIPRGPVPKPLMTPKEELQIWAERYCADKLKSKGFISYNNENLSWYKVINNELLMSVYLFLPFGTDPLVASIAYGMHPLCLDAPVPQTPVARGWPHSVVFWELRGISLQSFKETPRLMVPRMPLCGAELLDREVFSIFDQVNSLEDAYQYFKKYFLEGRARRLNGENTHEFPSLEFVEFVVYMGDEEMYPFCLEFLKRITLEKREPLIAAIQGGQREAYLAMLEDRRKKLVRKLNRKLGFNIV